jgi:hypothetical protein
MHPTVLVPLVSLALLTPLAAEDLAKRYPGKLTWAEFGLTWECRPEDVWALKSFALTFGKDFALECGKAEVVLGQHERNVLWAVVFPEQPAKLRARGQPGDGASVRSIFLRFAPAEIGRVFPSKTVVGNGSRWLRAEAIRTFRHKLGYDWYTPAGNPTVVPGGITLVDVDTSSGARHFYSLEGHTGKLVYVPEFAEKPLPPAGRELQRKEVEEAFDQVWTAFDREYAGFTLLPKLEWDEVGAEARKDLVHVQSSYDLAALLADRLASLEDLHVWVQCGEDVLPGYSRPRPQNASWDGSFFVLDGGRNDTGHDLVWGRTKDGIGYLNVHALTDTGLTAAFDEALEALADTWGLVLDLRFNGGGGEDLAQALAGRFIDVERVYSKNRYRIGPKHEQLGDAYERRLGPRGPWRYESPVIALQGQRTMSSAESFALMLAQCPQVTTLGDHTAGSSANPRRIELECGITVNLPRWLDMDPEGRPIEHVGIQPKVKLEFPPEAFTEQKDPVLEAALARLRKTPSGERKPGKR